jgi:predicted Zn-dependent protease
MPSVISIARRGSTACAARPCWPPPKLLRAAANTAAHWKRWIRHRNPHRRHARVLRARVLRRDGKPAEALALLAPESDKGTLTPAGWRELALAGLANGDTRRARAALDPLQKSGALGTRAYAALEDNGAGRLDQRQR